MTEQSEKFRSRAGVAVAWSATGTWVSYVASFVVFIFLARLLRPSAFGLVALTSGVITFVQILADQGLPDALIQVEELKLDQLDTVFWTGVVLAIVLAGTMMVAAPPIASAFHQADLVRLIRWYSIIFPLAALANVQVAILRRTLGFRFLALRTLVSAIVGGSAGILFAYLGFGAMSLVAQQLIAMATGVVMVWIIVDWRPRFAYSTATLRELAPFGGNVFGIKLLDAVSHRADDLLIGYFYGATALGYYTVAYRLLRIATFLITATANTAVFSVFSRIRSDPVRLRNALTFSTRVSMFIAFPVFAGLSCLAPVIISVLYGPNWTSSIPLMEVLAWVGIVHTVLYLNGAMLKAIGKPSHFLALNALAAATNFVALAIARGGGVIAFTRAYAIATIVLLPFIILVTLKQVQLPLMRYLREFLPPAFSAAGMFALLLGITRREYPLPGPWWLAISVGLGAVVYFSIAAMLVPGTTLHILRRIWGRSRTQSL